MVAAPTSVEIFCSYAHEDEAWLRKLETHLSLLKRQGLVSLWYDRLIVPGTDWAKTIDTHLETASVILLLVSADFFASDYCYGIEMKRALEREAAGEARVIPILVRPVDWKDAPFAHLQALPTDVKPIESWPNKDTALADVAAGLRRVIVEELPQLTASAPRAALPKIWNIPYPRNPFFLGRDAELSQIRHHLLAGQTTALSQPQAISGLGGIGKTQFALEYAYRYHQDYTAVLWARAESTEALISSYVAIASLLRLPEREAKEQDITVQAVKTWLQTHRDWLLILDNADELKLLPDFLPPSLGGHVLLTTRATATGRLANRLEIETMEPAQGALFLLRRAELIAPDAALSQVSQEEQELAMHISQELGGLPLALDQAGAYLEETGTDLAGYWQIYQQHRADLLRQRGGVVADHPAPVATTWSLSFQLIEEKNPAAADLLRLCAYLAPDAIPEEILTDGAGELEEALTSVAVDDYQLNQAVMALLAYSLIARNPRSRTLTVHRLVQAVIRDSMSAEAQQQWMSRAIQAVGTVYPSLDFANWPTLERLLPHALLCTTWIEHLSLVTSKASHLLSLTGYYLCDRGHYAEAEPLLQRAFAIDEQELGANHPGTARSLNNLAELYRARGKYIEAQLLYQRSLAICERELGASHPDMAGILNNLAALYYDQGKYVEAVPLYQRALEICEQELGTNHSQTATSLNNLAELYRVQGRYEKAESLYQRALSIYEQELGANHPGTAQILSNLANLYDDQGKYAEAELLHQRALATREQELGDNHPNTAQSLNNLANLCQVQGKYAEAELLHQRALTIREQKLGASHPDTATSLNNLALLYRVQGKYAEAELLYQRALTIYEQELRANHPLTGGCLNNLAGLYCDQGKYAEAELLYQRSLAICERELGASHPDTARSLGNLAELYFHQGKYTEAVPLSQRALVACEQTLGSEHPTTRLMQANYTALLEAMQ